jgi:hypothetical protein
MKSMIRQPNRLPGRRKENERTGGLKLLAADGKIKKFNADLDRPVSTQRCPAGGRRRNSRPCASGLRCRISTGVDVATVALLFSLLINEKNMPTAKANPSTAAYRYFLLAGFNQRETLLTSMFSSTHFCQMPDYRQGDFLPRGW